MAFRLAVIKLGEMGRTRDWIAARLGVAPATLNDWVTPAGQTVARVTALGTAMGLLTPELRALVASELLAQLTPEYLQAALSRIPLGRPGTLEEAAAMITWMCSSECSFCTGAVFDLSGGRGI